MYQKANLVHDNMLHHILWHNKHCYFIDFSQTLKIEDSNSLYVLSKNCEHITHVSIIDYILYNLLYD